MGNVKLTKLERAKAISEARAAGCEFADEVIVEMAEEDKRRALEEAEKGELAQLRKRVVQLERLVGRNGDRIYSSVGKAIGKTLPKYLDQQLAQRLVLRDAGVWRPDRQYEAGELVSCGGSGWVCKAQTRERPGADPTAWRLAIKKGRDANG